jgi:hypothetical protein
LSFFALYLWDKSHEGSGLRGILKVVKKLFKLMGFFLALIVTLFFTSAFIETGFWSAFFVGLAGANLFCTSVNILLLFLFIFFYATKK